MPSLERRIEKLQAHLSEHQWDAFICPHNDVHFNEYLPDHAKLRDWLIGFTGSAGDVLVQQTSVTLFADSRYHQQAEDEVPLSHVQISKVGLEGEKTLAQTLKTLPPKSRIAFDPKTLGQKTFEHYKQETEHLRFEWILAKQNPIEELQALYATLSDAKPGTPELASTLRMVEDSVHGRSTTDKLAWLRQELESRGCNSIFLSRLDDIAWLTNLRGNDIPYNPVFLSFMWVDMDQAILFYTTNLDQTRIHAYLERQGIQIRPYTEVWGFLQSCVGDVSYAMPSSNSVAVFDGLVLTTRKTGPNFIQQEKSRKTQAEIHGMREANLRSSLAVIRTLSWLDTQAFHNLDVTEADLAAHIEKCYEDEGALDLSFNTIAGIAEHSAIIHYGTPSKRKKASPGDLVLLDSGAQYPFGTTDITRTTSFSLTASKEMKHAYTHVLKSHIACSAAIFPVGTSGSQLDGICRNPLWQAGYDFGHGTGHGVGCFLNVHEGPNGISKGYTQAIEVNTINSIEPGYYIPGIGGIRLENLALVVDVQQDVKPGTPQKKWLGFEPLNYIPFAKHLIDVKLLTEAERIWLAQYYAKIRQKIMPRLSKKHPKALTWLEAQLNLDLGIDLDSLV